MLWAISAAVVLQLLALKSCRLAALLIIIIVCSSEGLVPNACDVMATAWCCRALFGFGVSPSGDWSIPWLGVGVAPCWFLLWRGSTAWLLSIAWLVGRLSRLVVGRLSPLVMIGRLMRLVDSEGSRCCASFDRCVIRRLVARSVDW
jgi:hypothetical protein